MDIHGAIKAAKDQVKGIFAEENISNIGLEEIERNQEDKIWIITIGFSRPWDEPDDRSAIIIGRKKPRTYKVITLSEDDGRMLSIKNRSVEN